MSEETPATDTPEQRRTLWIVLGLNLALTVGFGVTGLIVGGAAAAALAKNTGIFATLLLLLKKFWVVGIALVGGAFAGIRNLFTSKATKTAAKAQQRSATAFFDGPAASSETPPDTAAETPAPEQGQTKV